MCHWYQMHDNWGEKKKKIWWKPTSLYSRILIYDEIVCVWLRFFFLCTVRPKRAQKRHVSVCPEMGSTENQRLLRHCSWRTTYGCGGQTGTYTTLSFFFFLKWPHLGLSGLCRNQPSPQLVQKFNSENSQHTACHKSRTEHTHEARTRNKPLTCANV